MVRSCKQKSADTLEHVLTSLPQMFWSVLSERHMGIDIGMFITDDLYFYFL